MAHRLVTRDKAKCSVKEKAMIEDLAEKAGFEVHKMSEYSNDMFPHIGYGSSGGIVGFRGEANLSPEEFVSRMIDIDYIKGIPLKILYELINK
jgi:hypothetical protein